MDMSGESRKSEQQYLDRQRQSGHVRREHKYTLAIYSTETKVFRLVLSLPLVNVTYLWEDSMVSLKDRNAKIVWQAEASCQAMLSVFICIPNPSIVR